jgi:hypothetical protein
MNAEVNCLLDRYFFHPGPLYRNGIVLYSSHDDHHPPAPGAREMPRSAVTAGQVCKEGEFDVADKSLGAQVHAKELGKHFHPTMGRPTKSCIPWPA